MPVYKVHWDFIYPMCLQDNIFPQALAYLRSILEFKEPISVLLTPVNTSNIHNIY